MKIYKFVCPECNQSRANPIEEVKNMQVDSEIESLTVNEQDEILPEELEYGPVEYSEMEDGISIEYICPVCLNTVAQAEDEIKQVFKEHGTVKEI